MGTVVRLHGAVVGLSTELQVSLADVEVLPIWFGILYDLRGDERGRFWIHRHGDRCGWLPCSEEDAVLFITTH